jgi:hypothetical protein
MFKSQVIKSNHRVQAKQRRFLWSTVAEMFTKHHEHHIYLKGKWVAKLKLEVD